MILGELKSEMTKTDPDVLLTAACNFQALSLKSREACREEYRRKEPNEHNVLRILIDGQIASLAHRFSNQTIATDEGISYQLTIFTSYIRSHFVINDLIMGGDVIEALTVVRRQIEALARLNEIDSRPLQKLLGKTPNVRNILGKHSGSLYGYLSEVAHSASPHISILLGVVSDRERAGTSLTPMFSDSLGAAFEVHWYFSLYFLVWVIKKFAVWYPDYDNSDDERLIEKTLFLAVQAGVLRYPPSEPEAKEG